MMMMMMKPGVKTRKKAAFMPAELAAELTLLLAYDVFPVILQNFRPSGVFFSKETVCEKFQIAREKVVVTVTTILKSGCDMSPPSHTKLRLWILCVVANAAKSFKCSMEHIRMRFYRVFNSLYAKHGANSDLVTVELMKSYCMPFILYATEALAYHHDGAVAAVVL